MILITESRHEEKNARNLPVAFKSVTNAVINAVGTIKVRDNLISCRLCIALMAKSTENLVYLLINKVFSYLLDGHLKSRLCLRNGAHREHWGIEWSIPSNGKLLIITNQISMITDDKGEYVLLVHCEQEYRLGRARNLDCWKERLSLSRPIRAFQSVKLSEKTAHFVPPSNISVRFHRSKFEMFFLYVSQFRTRNKKK